MLIRGRFPFSPAGPGGLAGIALWDHGQHNINDEDFYKDDPDFYRRELERKLVTYAGCLKVCEFEQEAHYQTRDNRSWATLDLRELAGFGSFLLENRLWSIHAPVSDTDITDYENQIHLEWSLRETREAIDFAFRCGADVLVLHPGTYNTKSRRFWPAPEDALAITNNRRVALNTSLQALIDHFLYRLEEWHGRLAQFVSTRKGIADDLRGLFAEQDSAAAGTLARYRASAQILELVARENLGIDLVRYCRDPGRGLRLAIENVEPPNFVVNTTGQLRRVHSLMMELYQEGFERASSLPGNLFDRFRPGMVLDTTHLLNSKVILGSPEHESIGHIFEDYETLTLPFVSLPGEFPTDSQGDILEPLLNRFAREGSDDLVYVYLAGSQRTDRFMTTHDPIGAMRTKMQLHPGSGQGGPAARYSLSLFDPDMELNLSEVIQVFGADKTYLMKLFDQSPERHLTSFHNVTGYLEFLREEEVRARDAVLRHLEAMRRKPGGERPARLVEDRLGSARFYVRPYRRTAEVWRLGYDEAGFYSYNPARADTAEIFATVKEETGQVWTAPAATLAPAP